MDQNFPSTFTLDRLLDRLSTNLTSSDGEAKLRASQFDRTRTGANLEHARALLLTLEKQSSSVRVQTQRQQLQAHLQQKREQIKSLHAHLRELDRSDDESDDHDRDDDDDSSDNEDLLNTYAPARRDVDAGIEAGEPQTSRISETQTQELRARRPAGTTTGTGTSTRSTVDTSTASPITTTTTTTTTTATTTSSAARPTATTSAREQLFAARAGSNTNNSGESASAGVQATETLMSHNRTEQEALTTGLLALASALKQSSVSFSGALEAEKEVLRRAEGGLDKNATGMEAAERKMSALRRMHEGQGWWGRVKLYAFIAALWVACFLLAFVGPKLRF